MKKILYCAVALLITCAINMSAQNLSKKELKQAEKESKEWADKGWQVKPGTLSIGEQLIRGKSVETEIGKDNMPSWIIAVASSQGSAYNAARMQSLSLAKSELASKVASDLTGLVENKLGNNEGGELESISATILASKEVFTHKLGLTRTLMECYRDLPDGRVEVLIRIAYPHEKAMDAMKKAIKDYDDINDGNMSKRLDEILGW